MNFIRVDRICKRFDGNQVLDNVTFTFQGPGMVAIVGPNGAGKSTLFNIVTGFVKPDSGACFVGERDITNCDSHRIVRNGIARTFQDTRVIREMSALDNVLLARPRQRGEHFFWGLFPFSYVKEENYNRDEGMRLLEFVGLATESGKRSGELSYGQQKLLTLACCLATQAKIVLLDEPIAGLDPQMIDRVLGLLQAIHNNGTLIVFVEHDLATVRQIAHQVVVMDKGKIVASGRPGELLDRADIMEVFFGSQ